MSKYQTISELLDDTSLKITSNKNEWRQFLESAAWTFKYSFEDQVLIYAQKPNAKACAEFDTWNNKLHRWIKSGSKGIALIKDTPQGSSLRYVFDISDTRSINDRELKLWSVHNVEQDDLLESLQDTFGLVESNDLVDVIQQISMQLVEDNNIDYNNSLIKYRDGSILAEFSEQEVSVQFKELLVKSVQYCIMVRCELDVDLFFDEDDFYNISQFNTHETVGLLGSACRDISEMGLSEIGRIARSQELAKNQFYTFAKANKKIQNTSNDERSTKDGQTNHIQSSERLSNAESDNGGYGESRQIRHDEKNVFEESSTRSILQVEGDKSVERTFADDRATSATENGDIDTANVEENTSTQQGIKSNGVGTTYEQYSNDSGENRSQRDRLQLDLGGAEADIKPTLPPFNMHDLSTLLREEETLKHSKEEIVKFFHEHTDDQERAEYLETCYDDGYVETFRDAKRCDYTHIGYKKNDDIQDISPIHKKGLTVWLGSYMTRKTESFLTFQYLQNVVAKLIDEDEYLVDPLDKKSEIQLEYERGVMNYATKRAIFTNHENLNASSPEVISFFKEHNNKDEQCEFVKNLYNDMPIDFIVEDVSMGYKKEEDGLLLYYGTYQNQEQERLYEWWHIAGFIDGLVLARYYDPSIQIPRLEDQKHAIYKSVDDFNNNKFFSQEEIDRVLVRGDIIQQGKLRIYQQFQKQDTIENNVLFLKRDYGIGGATPVIEGAHMSEWHDAKGITLKKDDLLNPDVEITIKWKDVAKRIQTLISLDRYLNVEEKKEYTSFLQKQIDDELEDERETLEETISIPTHKEYVYEVGSPFYRGIDEYEIISINNANLEIQDKNFPLFTETLSLDEFHLLLKENPLNDRLLQDVEDTTEQIQQDDEKNIDKVFQQGLPIIIEKIKDSEIYPILRDRDTAVEEAEKLIKDQLLPIVSSINVDHHDFYTAYMEHDSFKKLLIEDILDKTYQDISSGIDYSSLLTQDDDNQKVKHINNEPETLDIMTEKIDYHIQDEQLGIGTPKIRYTNNIAAIRLLFSLEKDKQFATSEQQEVLAKYVGWGGLADAFDETNSSWDKEYHELKSLLNEEEYRSARESTLSAFYTSPVIIDSIYQAIENMGFKYGNILEPACGSRVIIMTEANSLVKSKVLKLLPKLKTEETDGLCAA